jgi:DNA topoisomerase I
MSLAAIELSRSERTANHNDPSSNEAVHFAEEAGLRYVTDAVPGIRRQRKGEGFVYYDTKSRRIDDDRILSRIKKLVIPPAYVDVWICPFDNGHIQATGRDAKGRKQYRYHPLWRESRDENKFHRMIEFAQALPIIRQRVAHDLATPGMPREKVLATIVRLLELTHIRVGNEEYARTNRSFGLTTLANEHVEIEKSVVKFHFRGKSGKYWTIDLKDRKLAAIVRKSSELPGQHLFEYLDSDGKPHAVTSSDVNAYIHEMSGMEFTAKDFRTWAGTVLAMMTLADCEPCTSATGIKRNVVEAIKIVSEHLGNTPAVCRRCYIHPAILDAYLNGTFPAPQNFQASEREAQCEEEALRLIKKQSSEKLRAIC